MGKIAVKKLFGLIFVLITFSVALLGLITAFVSYFDPRTYHIAPLLGLGFPVIMLANLLLALFWLVCGRWRIALVFVAVIVVNSYNIAKVYQLPFGRTEINLSATKPETKLRVVSYNVGKFNYLKSGSTKEEIAKFVFDSNADVVCLQEYRGDIYSSDTVLQDFNFLPYRSIVDKNPGRLITAILSKYPILNSQQLTQETTNNSGVYSDLDVNGKIIRVFCLHFQTTNVNQVRSQKPTARESISSPQLKKDFVALLMERMNENWSIRSDQADIIRSIIDTTKQDVIVCCDMNDTPNSFVYRRIRGDLKDGFISEGKNCGYTFDGFFNLLRIDYIFYSHGLKAIGYSSPRLPWSDHYPVLTDFELKNLR